MMDGKTIRNMFRRFHHQEFKTVHTATGMMDGKTLRNM
jgi:hypothetical protein